MATDLSEFEEIRPYNDEEAISALNKYANHPLLAQVSAYMYPEESPDYLGKKLLGIKNIDEFQAQIVIAILERIIRKSADKFTYSGIEHLFNSNGKFLAMTNHRDIVLDPAFIQLILFKNGLPFSEIAVGSNLLQNEFIETLIRSNRMIKVLRGIPVREQYLTSQLLSRYIRESITTGRSSVWIAQRQGRTKNGLDQTEQGLIKMLDMSGDKGFVEDFIELNIIPMSISYEYEPCDIFKARETVISQEHKYVKLPGEDIQSILAGIKRYKGNIHICIGSPITAEEISSASLCNVANDRYRWMRHLIENRIIVGYKLWKTNYMAYDMLHGSERFAKLYSESDKANFEAYVEKQLALVEPEVDRTALREAFLNIYANPIVSKESLYD
ncbi:MAG: acyltransferase [Bacteroidales bacterium]|nr:acyltransferase [Bacteroidales bacterium]